MADQLCAGLMTPDPAMTATDLVFLTCVYPDPQHHVVACSNAWYRSRTEAAGDSADSGIEPPRLYISVVMLPQRQCKGSEQTVLEAEPKRRYRPPDDPRSMRFHRAIQRGAGPTTGRSQQQGNGSRCSRFQAGGRRLGGGALSGGPVRHPRPRAEYRCHFDVSVPTLVCWMVCDWRRWPATREGFARPCRHPTIPSWTAPTPVAICRLPAIALRSVRPVPQYRTVDGRGPRPPSQAVGG